MAIDTMSWIMSGKIFAHRQGVERFLDTYPTRVEAPVYSNFAFWHRIKPLPIQKVLRVEPTAEVVGHWTVERKVQFYLQGKLMAIVELVGMRPDESCLGQGLDNASFWGVSRVGYFLSGGGLITDPPTDWREVDLVPSESGRFMVE